jgi:WD40 repeat protein
MVGHNKRVLSTSFKPTRPFRIFTGGEDMKTIIFAGPPFKLQKSFTEVHSNFVNCVRYSPNGNRVVSVGSDKKMQFYEGATGDLLGEVSNAHAGSIYSASFSADSTKLLTSSADKTVKLWDVETRTCEKTFTFGTELGDMQVSVLWAGSYMVSVSLSGNINILNPADPTKPSTVFNAHQVAITSMAYDAVTRTLYSGSFDGVLCATPVDTGISTRIVGADKKLISAGVHTNKISGVVVTNGQVLSVAWDDTVRTTDIATKSAVASQSLNGQPCGIAAAKDSDLVVVATTAEIAVFRGTNKINAFSDVSFGATCIAITANGDEVAVGGNDNKTRIYSVAADGSMTAVTTIATRSPVSALAYSPVSDVLAIGDNGRQVEVYERGTWTPRVQGRWVNHTSRITALAWSPNGQFLASGSTDESIFIWNSAKNISFHQLNFTHHSGVSGVAWIDDTHLVSTGNDHCIVTWDLTAAIAAI